MATEELQVAKNILGLGNAVDLISFSLLTVFLVILVISVIDDSIKERSVIPVIEKLGSRMAFVTHEAGTLAKNIMDRGGVYERNEDNFFKGIWRFLSVYGRLYFLLYIIYIWILLIFKALPYLTGIDQTSVLRLGAISILVFLALQSLFITFQAHYRGEIDSFNEGDKSVVNLIASPIYDLYNLVKVVPFLIKPVVGIAERVIPGENYPRGEKTPALPVGRWEMNQEL